MLHQKTMVVDGRWATIGTTNFDNRSFALNEESNVSFDDPALVEELQRTFEQDVARAEPVTLDRWRRRGVLAHAEELVASLFVEQA